MNLSRRAKIAAGHRLPPMRVSFGHGTNNAEARKIYPSHSWEAKNTPENTREWDVRTLAATQLAYRMLQLHAKGSCFPVQA